MQGSVVKWQWRIVSKIYRMINIDRMFEPGIIKKTLRKFGCVALKMKLMLL